MRRLSLLALSAILFSASTRAAGPFDLPKPTDSFTAGTLHVHTYGTGKQALILIPGLAGGPWVWHDTISRFSNTYTIYALTLPGFDGSPPTDKSPLFSTVSNDLWQLLADRHIIKPIVIGHSLGGTLAIALAEEHPDRLAAIVSLDGLPVFPMLAFATPNQRQSAATQIAKSFESHSPEQWIANQKSYMAQSATTRPDIADAAGERNAKSDPKAVAAWSRELLTLDLRPNLGKITIPVLVLMPYNAADATPPRAYTLEQTKTLYRSLLTGVPHLTVIPIESARHFLMLDQPDAFHQALDTFLESVEHPATSTRP